MECVNQCRRKTLLTVEIANLNQYRGSWLIRYAVDCAKVGDGVCSRSQAANYAVKCLAVDCGVR